MKSISNLLSLKGQTAVVTGGAVGIGYGISYRLAEAGANVVIADVSPDNLETAKKALKDKGWAVSYVQVDVSQVSEVQTMVGAAVEEYGSLDILVNNAGIYPQIMMMDLKPEQFDKVIAVNLKGLFMATQAAAKQMIKQGKGGRIINITSIDALHPSSVGLAHYDASKHGAWGFTKNTALELAPHKIWVNAVAPGGIITPGATGAPQPTKGVDMANIMEIFLAKIPMRRMGEPDEIGKVVLFLASDMSSYMTGSQIVVDGGVLLS